MTMDDLLLSSLMLILALAMTGCAGPAAALFTDPTATPTVTPTATSTPRPTDTPSPTATRTTTPWPTDTPTAVAGLLTVPPPTALPPTPTPIPPATGIVSATALNLRGGPGMDYTILGHLRQGRTVTITSQTADGQWLSVNTAGNQTGWVATDFVTLHVDPTTIPVARDVVATAEPAQAVIPATADSPFTLIIKPAPVIQGQTFVLRVETTEPMTVTGTLGDRHLTFVEEAPQVYWSPAGIGPMSEPGSHQLSLQAMAADGREFHRIVPVQVVPGRYLAEKIKLPPEVAALLDPELVRAERRRLEKMWAQFRPEKLWRGLWTRPGEGKTTSAFGTRRSFGGGPVRSYHAGQDFQAKRGDPVTAPAAGIIALAEPLIVRGNVVWIDHGLGVYSGYFHLSEILVEAGQEVEPGQLIGRVGSTGLSTGPHLHWEVRVHGIAVNPLEWTRREIGP